MYYRIAVFCIKRETRKSFPFHNFCTGGNVTRFNFNSFKLSSMKNIINLNDACSTDVQRIVPSLSVGIYSVDSTEEHGTIKVANPVADYQKIGII